MSILFNNSYIKRFLFIFLPGFSVEWFTPRYLTALGFSEKLSRELIPSEFIKDLGVTLDPTLSFNKHISVAVSSCMSNLAQISRAKNAFNSDLLVIIINALVFNKLY